MDFQTEFNTLIHAFIILRCYTLRKKTNELKICDRAFDTAHSHFVKLRFCMKSLKLNNYTEKNKSAKNLKCCRFARSHLYMYSYICYVIRIFHKWIKYIFPTLFMIFFLICIYIKSTHFMRNVYFYFVCKL